MKVKSVKKNYVFNLIYQILLVIIPLITTPYLSRVLFKEGIGQYSFAFSLITYFVLFATFGFDHYSQREIAKHQDDNEQQSITFWEIFISRNIPVLISLCVHLCLLAFNVYGGHQTLMQILTINILAVGLDVSFYLQGNEEFGKLVLRNSLIKILLTVFIFIFVKSSSDLWIYALISSLSIIISNLTLWPYVIKHIKKVKFNQLKPLKHLPRSLKLFIPAIAVSVYTVLDKTLIGFITNSSAQNGYYEQAEKIVKIAMTLITCLGTIMISRNTHEISCGNHEKVKENIYTTFNFIWLLGVPLTLGMIVIASNAIPWFLGADFNYSSTLLMCFAPLILIIGCSNILGLQYLIPYGREKQYTIALIIGSCVNLILNIVLITHFQSLGATIATIIAELTVLFVMCLFVKKDLSLKNMFKTILKPLIAGTIMFVCLIPLSLCLSPSVINTLIIACVGVAIYGLCIILLRERLALTYITLLKNKLKSRFK